MTPFVGNSYVDKIKRHFLWDISFLSCPSWVTMWPTHPVVDPHHLLHQSHTSTYAMTVSICFGIWEGGTSCVVPGLPVSPSLFTKPFHIALSFSQRESLVVAVLNQSYLCEVSTIATAKQKSKQTIWPLLDGVVLLEGADGLGMYTE